MLFFHENKTELEKVKREIKVHGIYTHFKGGKYIVEDIARDSETGKEMVVYRSLKDGKLWVRPKEMFMDIKATEHGYTFRFSRHLMPTNDM